MAGVPTDPERRRRTQRRRALIGWLGGLLAVAAFVALIALAGVDVHHRRHFKVPYGEYMTAKDYAEINEGEEDATVLTRLAESGRPESFTEPYVLVLFPQKQGDVYCTYWEFSDEPQIFARLCFDKSSGELTQKLKHSVLHPPLGTEGPMV